jgi:hypothetical protein
VPHRFWSGQEDAIMPKHYEAEVRARAVRLGHEHMAKSGSVIKSCEASAGDSASARRRWAGGIA